MHSGPEENFTAALNFKMHGILMRGPKNYGVWDGQGNAETREACDRVPSCFQTF